MTAILDTLSPEVLLEVLDDTLGGYCLVFGRLPGGEAHDDAALRWFVGGAPDEAINGVIRARLDPEQVDGAVERMLDEFRRRQLPAR